MPLPVIPDVYQVRLVWTDVDAQRPATTVMHIEDSAGTFDASGVANAVDANVTANMWQLCSSNALVDHIDVTPLDGLSSTFTLATGAPAKWKGSGGADPILQGAIVISLKCASRGPNWRNRMFLPFVGETGQAAGVLTPANVTAMQTAWSAFRTAVAAGGFPLHVVTQRGLGPEPAPALDSSQVVTSVIVRPYLKTQRRRARR